MAGMAFGQTANVQKGSGSNDITADLNVGSGRTVTVKSGGTLNVSSGALGLSDGQIPAVKVNGVLSSIKTVFQTENATSSLIGEANGNILILGDSITDGFGATSYSKCYASLVQNSIWNAVRRGFKDEPPFNYACIARGQNLIQDTGVTTNGAVGPYGIFGGQVILEPGQSVSITSREITYVQAWYDASNSTGSLIFSLNGVDYLTATPSGAGLQITPLTALPSTTRTTDVVSIRASGGTFRLCGLSAVHASNASPGVFVCSQSGTAIQDYTGAQAISDLTTYMQWLGRTENSIICTLGSNSITNPTKALSPSAMVAEMANFVSLIRVALPHTKFWFTVPPRANYASWPIVLDFTYDQYVSAIIEFCAANNHGCLRGDMLDTLHDNTADGLHPNDYGHRMWAEMITRSLQIPCNGYKRTIGPANVDMGNLLVNGTASFLNSTETPLAIVSGSIPLVKIVNTNGGLDAKRFQVLGLASGVNRSIYFSFLKDDESASNAAFELTSNGATPTGANFYARANFVGGIGGLSGLIKGNGTTFPSAAVAGTDYVIPAGNVATATALATPRTINGVSFDGTGNVTVPSVKLNQYTVAGLPTGAQGDVALVTDAATSLRGSAPSGGGSTKWPVFHNGTAWVCY